jgi:quinol monooxygenase YgiN
LTLRRPDPTSEAAFDEHINTQHNTDFHQGVCQYGREREREREREPKLFLQIFEIGKV